jgi:hypothetical protein
MMVSRNVVRRKPDEFQNALSLIVLLGALPKHLNDCA